MISEIQHYLHHVEDLRHQVRDLVTDLPAEALNWRPLAAGEDHAVNSLAVLAAHVAGAEHFWIAEVVGGLPASRSRDSEFQIEVEDAQPLMARLEAVGAETRAILEGLSVAELDKQYAVRERTVSGRWAILHVIDHTALHLGHMQITYQLWNRGQGVDAPRWHQRLPAG